MRFRKDPVKAVAIIAFFGTAALVFLSQQLKLPRLEPVAMVVFSAAPLALGIQAVVTRRFSYFIGQSFHAGLYKENYQGTGAVALGLCMLIIGLGLLVAGLISLTGTPPLEGFFEQNPGLAFAGVGALLTLFGISQAMQSVTRAGVPMAGWKLLPERFGGLLTAMIGMAICAGGLLYTLSPSLFGALRTALAGLISDLVN